MQSSSGGDEEYDSRGESVPAFLNPSTHFGGLSNLPHPSLFSVHHQSHQPTFFDPPPPNYLTNPFSQSHPHTSSPNIPLLNLDLLRSTTQRSDQPNCTNLIANPPASSSSPQRLNQSAIPSSSSQSNAAKNPKKRTRASRRAPTTVLTTDTSNFRAMVQEFTGIPAPPFSGSSYSRRLDLFGSAGSALRSGTTHLEPLGNLYPLRPAPQKLQPTSVSTSTPSSSSSSPLLVDATNIAIASSSGTNNTSAPTTNSINVVAPTNTSLGSNSTYQQLLPAAADLSLQKQTLNILSMQNQNPLVSFQSLLQHPPPGLQSSLSFPGFSAKSHGTLPIHSFEGELGVSHGTHVGGLTLQGNMTHEGDRLSSWRDGVGLKDVGNQDDHQLRPFDGSYGGSNSQRVNNNNSCKLNYSASSSDFHHHHDKGLENVSSRAEGTVDSWICPSD